MCFRLCGMMLMIPSSSGPGPTVSIGIDKEMGAPVVHESARPVQMLWAGIVLTFGYGLVCHVFPLFMTFENLMQCAQFHFALAMLTMLGTSMFKTAPYGKHSSDAVYPEPYFSARVAWMVMESPTLVAVLYGMYSATADRPKVGVQLLFETNWLQDATTWLHPLLSALTAPLRLFALHYVHRALIFPFSVKGARPVPLRIVLAATLYCSFNGSLQMLATQPQGEHQRPPSFMDLSDPQWYVAAVGFVLFITGFAINVMSDYALIDLKAKNSLRKPLHSIGGRAPPSRGDHRYSIPSGFWLFNYVSCPNFFGEIVEWLGYALFATAFAVPDYETDFKYSDLLVLPWQALVGAVPPSEISASSMAAFSFAVYTVLFLIPRGLATHRWYLKTFGKEYQQLNRKAVIPFIL